MRRYPQRSQIRSIALVVIACLELSMYERQGALNHEVPFAVSHAKVIAGEREKGAQSTILSSSVLTNWEHNSAAPQRSCRPPPGVPEYCCLGAIAMAGGPVRYKPKSCNLPLTDFDIHNHTAEFVSGPLDHCDVCDIVDQLARHSWSLSFVGDSVTRQSFAGLECALHHAGYAVARDFQNANRSHVKVGLSPGQELWRYGLRDVTSLRVSKHNAASQVATIRYYSMYRPLDDMSEIVDIYKHNDIVVFDFGLHFKPATELELFATLVKRLTATKPQPNLLAWRETSSQHFSTPYGHYDNQDGIIENKRCVKLSSNETFGVRRNIVEATLRTQLQEPEIWTPGNLLFIPFRDFTSGLHDLHNPTAINGGLQDCTHYCHTPYLWMPIWNGLRLGMDKLIAAV